MKHPTTSPLAFVLHSLISLFVGALGAGGAFAIQQIGSGSFSLPVLLTGAFMAFSSYFGAGFIMLEKAPETKQAVAQSLDNLATVVGSHSGAIGSLIQEVRKLTPPTAPVQQQPFPGQSFAPAQPLNWTGLELPAAPK